MTHYDDLETRSAEERARDLKTALQDQIGRAQMMAGYAESLAGVDALKIRAIALLSLWFSPWLAQNDLRNLIRHLKAKFV